MRKTILFSLTLTMAISTAWAQETKQQGTEQQNTEQKQSGVVEQRAIIATASSDGDGVPKIEYFSTTTDGPMTGNFVLAEPGGFAAMDPFSLVNNKSVQKEIELVDEQLQQISDVRREFSKKISAQIGDLTKAGWDQGRGEKIKELVDELNAKRKLQMEQVLLPHQLERLKQISFQQQMQHRGNAETLANKEIAEELGISDKQKERIQKRAKSIKEKLEAKIARLKEEAKEELLDELSSDQRRKLKEMTGASFEMKNEDWRSRIRSMRKSNAKNNSGDQDK